MYRWKNFHSYQAARNMFNDSIFNFAWLDKPKGCIEIEYLNLGKRDGIGDHPPSTEVAIGRLREVSCQTELD
jgi:hypothetical protein